MSDEQQDGAPGDADFFAAPDYDPDRFMTSLVYTPEAGDLPVPPRLTDDDVVLVSRKLPFDVDTELRAAAAAERITVEELLRRWARNHHAA